MNAMVTISSLVLVTVIVPCIRTRSNRYSPTQTSQQQCLDFNRDKICEYVVLANGTMVANPTVRNATVTNSIAESQITVLPATDECSEYDKDGLRGSGARIEGLTCVDANHDFSCDSFKPVNTIPVNNTVIPPQVTPQDACYNKGFHDAAYGNSTGTCVYPDEYLLGLETGRSTRVPTPVVSGPAPIVQVQDLVCQSNDDFCESGCEQADMQCIGEGNDDNKNGVKDSKENQGGSGDSDNDNNRNDDDNNDDKTYCDVPNPSNPCHDRRDGSETNGLYTCMDGSHEADWKDCNGSNNDDDLPNCKCRIWHKMRWK
jgi:hypothetical protein